MLVCAPTREATASGSRDFPLATEGGGSAQARAWETPGQLDRFPHKQPQSHLIHHQHSLLLPERCSPYSVTLPLGLLTCQPPDLVLTGRSSVAGSPTENVLQAKTPKPSKSEEYFRERTENCQATPQVQAGMSDLGLSLTAVLATKSAKAEPQTNTH